MWNLELSNVSIRDLESPLDGSKIACNETQIFSLRPSCELIATDRQTGSTLRRVQAPYEPATAFELLEFEKRLCFGSGNRLIHIRTDDFERGFREIALDEPIVAGKWSPDQHYLALVFESGDVTVNTVDFETGLVASLGRCSLYDDAPSGLAVGWGSEATQFKGRAGRKEERDGDAEEIDSGAVDSKRAEVSWHGDAERFVVSHGQTFKTFALPCRLIHAAEGKYALLSSIACRPTGNCVAVGSEKPRKSLVFFELNGLYRSQVDLDIEGAITDLKWDESGIIAVQHTRPDNKSSISLFASENWHWHQKHQLNFAPNDLAAFQFTTPLSLLIVTSRRILAYSFRRVYQNFVASPTEVLSLSVSGTALLASLFDSVSVLPPPMFTATLRVAHAINHVVCGPNSYKFAVVDSNNSMSLWELKEGRFCAGGSFWLGDGAFRNFVWRGDDVYYVQSDVISETPPGRKNCVFRLVMSRSLWSAEVVDEVPDSITGFSCVSNGALFVYETNERQIVVNELLFDLPASPDKIEAVLLDGRCYVFSLCDQDFYVNDSKRISGVRSFVFYKDYESTPKYVFVTTLRNELLGIRIEPKSLDLPTKPFARPIEAGAVLLCNVPQTASLILQMPRGNLEAINCRMIEYDMIEALLEKGDFSGALDRVRASKIDQNILIDSNLPRFVGNVPSFIDRVDSAAVLKTFLLEIARDERVPDKLERSLLPMIRHMMRSNYPRYVGCVMIACLKLASPDSLSLCVQHILTLMNMVEQPGFGSLRNEFPEHLADVTNLVPPADLYRQAFLTYDLDLAAFLARRLNVDPRVYEPFIDKLSQLAEPQRRFEINLAFDRFPQAFRFLLDYESREEALGEFVAEHRIHKQAYHAIAPNSPLKTFAAKLYATRLDPEEAATLLHQNGCYREALEQYVLGGCRAGAAECLEMLPEVGGEERRSCFRRLADRLVSRGRIVEAGGVLSDHLNEADEAVSLLVENGWLCEAYELAVEHRCVSTSIKKIATNLSTYCEDLITKYKGMNNKFTGHVTRLQEIRKSREKAFNNAENYEYMGDAERLGDDAISLAGSLSTVSISTTRSSRSKRKENRRLLDTRKGSQYEDIAIVRELHDISHQAFDAGQAVRKTLLLATRLGLPSELPIVVQDALKALQASVTRNLSQIWPADLNNCEERQTKAVQLNYGHLSPKYQCPPDNVGKKDWALECLPSVEDLNAL